jgi:hypothetical protein
MKKNKASTVLNAQVDLNTDKVTLLRQGLYSNTKTLLNQILARDTKLILK